MHRDNVHQLKAGKVLSKVLELPGLPKIAWLTIEGYPWTSPEKTVMVGTFLAGRSPVINDGQAANYNIYPEEILRIWLR
jgi:hypothetical protein